jgi:hypothetical protein
LAGGAVEHEAEVDIVGQQQRLQAAAQAAEQRRAVAEICTRKT